MERAAIINLLVCTCLILALSFCGTAPSERKLISLNGEWDLAQGSKDRVPEKFNHKIQVPGLVDLAQPSLEQVGFESDLREAFWYRKSFKIDGAVPAVALLKIHKAKYGSKIFLNDQEIGEHLPNFTPG